MSGIVEAPIKITFDHWLTVGYSVQTSMVLALARHMHDGNDADASLKSACRWYAEQHTNIRLADLV